MKKVLIILGTRPETIKLAPVIKELKKHKGVFRTYICVTAQHRSMLDQTLKIFNLTPDFDLNLMKDKQTLGSFAAHALNELESLVRKIKPDIIIVQGDTTTAMVGSLVAYYNKIFLAHVEAGLRTHNKYEPFPEEVNRKIISVIADIHFAPGILAKKNLIGEGIAENKIIITGNTVIDALLEIRKQLREKSLITKDLANKIKNKRIILVTGHRRENFDKGIQQLCDAINEIVGQYNDVCIVYSVHLNPFVYAPVHKRLSHSERVYLIEPLAYDSFIYLMSKAFLIISDSGGIQEEAPFLGIPVLVTRNITERPEATYTGNSKVIGMDKKAILENIKELIDHPGKYKKMAKVNNVYGEGQASLIIVNSLLKI